MFGFVGQLWRLGTMPVRALWTAYSGLWWAFDDLPRGTPDAATPGVLPPPEAIPKPVRDLKVGFVTTLALTGISVAIASAARSEHAISVATAVGIPLWVASAASVLTHWRIRRKHARRIAGAAARREAVVTAVRSVRDKVRDKVRTHASTAASSLRRIIRRATGMNVATATAPAPAGSQS